MGHWSEGKVDTQREHIVLTHGAEDLRVALLAPKTAHEFIVEFVLPADHPQAEVVLTAARQSLDYYLVEKEEPDPWRYARYHCTTAANLYSSIHWYYHRGDTNGEL